MIRGDLGRVDALLDGSEKWSWKVFDYVNCVAARLDGFVAVGRASEALEDAERYAVSGTYLEPFALRTLGAARSDPALIAQARGRFDAMGLRWYAAQTETLTPELVG
jgi:hypothetical protein